jgi:hypothetical protein
MDVHIGEVSSTVRLTEGQDQFTERIVQRVLAALADHGRLDQDSRRERRIAGGVRDDQEHED